MNDLRVFLFDHEVGNLDESSSAEMSFRYHGSWVNDPKAIPISRSMPLSLKTYKGGVTRAFFSGLLPEGNPRRKIAANLGISEENDFSLLSAIGGDCAGAIRLLGDVSLDKTEIISPSVSPLSQEELASLIKQLPSRPLLAGMQGQRLSLAGAQNKLPIRIVGNDIFLSSFDQPSTHILKPESPEYPQLATIEFLCMKLAEAVGIQVPKVQRLYLAGQPCLLVERFDREISPAHAITRLHQEDFCQSLGILPQRKYQQEGGPGVSDCIMLIRDWSSTPAQDLPHFLDGLIFNVLIGNADAHGKNFSWLYDQGQRRLSPLYDLVSTTCWPELTTRMAMRIGQAKYLNEVTRDHFLKMATHCRIGKPMLGQRMNRLCDAVQKTLPIVLEEHTDLPVDLSTQLRHDIFSRLEKIK
jgi:serine/threonine-protein kinase HipA